MGIVAMASEGMGGEPERSGAARTPAEERSLNERVILDTVRRTGGLARSEITAFTALTQQSVHRLVDGLIEEGLLRAGSPRRGGRGQPSPQIELVPEARVSLGVSVNTDSIDLCLSDLSCRILFQERLAILPTSREASLAAIAARFEEILDARAVPRAHVIGLGLGISGYLLADGRRMNAPEPLRDWSLMDLAASVEGHVPYPVQIANNATTGAIGESLQGFGRRFRTFAYLSFNEGFGGGLVIDGTPWFGAWRNAGEFSALFSEEDGRDRPALGSLVETLNRHGVEVASVADLRRRFDPDWPGVEEWLGRVRAMTDRIINALSGILDPEAIVFGGQIPPALAERLIANVTFYGKGRYGEPLPRPALLVSQMSSEAPALGAALLPMKGRYLP